MGVKKEYICFGHGAFESDADEPACPMGCSTIERAFLTPPAFHGQRTKNVDKTLESLAKSYKLTDLGPAAMRRKALQAEKSQDSYREFCQNRFGGLGWGGVPKGGTLNVKTGEIRGEGPGAVSAVAAVGGSGSIAPAEIHQMVPPKMNVIAHRDPENLSVKSAAA